MKKNFLLIVILCFVVTLFSAEFSKDFFGLDFEFQKDNIVDSVFYSDYFSKNTFDLMFTYGPEWSNPFRFRGGLGCFELSRYYGTVGVQFKILEFLNSVNGRAFGVYAATDFKMGLDYVAANLSGEIFIPFSAVSGILLGVGINHELSPFVSLSYSGGIYPIQVSNE